MLELITASFLKQRLSSSLFAPTQHLDAGYLVALWFFAGFLRQQCQVKSSTSLRLHATSQPCLSGSSFLQHVMKVAQLGVYDSFQSSHFTESSLYSTGL